MWQEKETPAEDSYYRPIWILFHTMKIFDKHIRDIAEMTMNRIRQELCNDWRNTDCAITYVELPSKVSYSMILSTGRLLKKLNGEWR